MGVLAGYDPELLAAWFDSTSRFLGGKRPRELLTTEPAKVIAAARNFPITRRLSAWLHETRPDAQGLCWTSRQNDEGRALMLFEPRLGSVKLAVDIEVEIFTDGPHLDTLLTLAERMGASVSVR